MIDSKSVIAHVTQKTCPSDWRVYYGSYHPGCLYFWTKPVITALVILPQGVVQWDIGNEENIGHFSFSGVQIIQLAGETQITGYDGYIRSRTYHWLDIYFSDGNYLRWNIGVAFQDAASIGKSIIAAFNHYCR